MSTTNTELDALGTCVLKTHFGSLKRLTGPIDIEALAQDFLRLNIRYTYMEGMDSLSAFEDAELVNGKTVQENSILLNDRLMFPLTWRDDCNGKRRFIVAWECANKMLYRLESAEVQQTVRKEYTARRWTTTALKNKSDRYHSLSKELAAALLMPAIYVNQVMEQYGHGHKLVCYGHRFTRPDQLTLEHLMAILGVTRSALINRLRQLDWLEDEPSWAFYDPTVITISDEEALLLDA